MPPSQPQPRRARNRARVPHGLRLTVPIVAPFQATMRRNGGTGLGIESSAGAPNARQTRSTPTAQRAANAGVEFKPPPSEFQDVINDEDARASAVARAKHQLHKHQNAVLVKVRRAEAAEERARLRQERARALRSKEMEAWPSDCPGLAFEDSALLRLMSTSTSLPTAEEHAREERWVQFENQKGNSRSGRMPRVALM